MPEDLPEYHGHRQRIRVRLLKSGTRAIILAVATVHLRVVDHLIVSAQDTFSFRKAGLL